MERVLQKLDGVEKALHRSIAESSSHTAPLAAPVAPLTALLPHNPVGSLVRLGRLLPAGTGFVGTDLAVSSRHARTAVVLQPMKEEPTATLAHLWSLVECLQSLELILQESHGSMLETPPCTFS
ncbi:unnamed protein product [Closterium sp. NIES-65]|nr:unnamed protein product [Closterium sp. NIES-65]